ncbi:MAG TPA: T9SS type A sorting domain-containing protein [Bacteroidetes bacterium]|nr:T9SS type A sorting domain-containing protein [Bacteroidota bacterium]
MKFKFSILSLFLFFIVEHLFAQSFEIRAVNKGSGIIGVEMRETSGMGTPATSHFLTDLTFGLKWSTTCGNIDLQNSITTIYNIQKSGSRGESGGFYFQAFFANIPPPFNVPENWTTNIWTEIMSVQNTMTAPGTCTFEIAETGFDASTNPNFGISYDGMSNNDFTPTINGSAMNVALPLELIRFSVFPKNKYIVLNWASANETNFSGYELQRSTNASFFHKIKWMAGKGSNGNIQNYRYEDRNIKPGILYYYRLKMVDNDGAFSFSKIQTANIGDGWGTPSIMPNPTTGSSILLFNSPTEKLVELKLMDSMGRVVFDKMILSGNGLNTVELDINSLPRGIYFLRLVEGGVVRWGERVVRI